MRNPGLFHRSLPHRLLFAAAAAGVFGACAAEPPEPPEAPEAEAVAEAEAPAIQRYEVRGVVGGLPTEASPALTVRHEAVPDFVDFEGEVVGMDSMSMPFPLADGVDITGIEPGDKVGFTLEVEWEGDVPYRISRIEELPAETELDLGG